MTLQIYYTWGGAVSPDQIVNFTGNVNLNGAYPYQIAKSAGSEQVPSGRSALPTFSEITYSATATSDKGETAEGIFPDNDHTKQSFTIGLTINRKWTITVTGKDSAGNEIFSAVSDEFEVSRETGSTEKNFIMKPGTSGSGYLELEIGIPAGIASVEVTCNSENKNKWTIASPISISGSKASIPKTSIASGTYEVTISFKDSNGFLLYSINQAINIFDKMTTNTWRSGGGSDSPITNAADGTGTFNLTSDLISRFARSIFYVGNTSAADASSSGTGSPYNPIDTFENAIKIIKDNGNSGTDYKIFISGKQSGNQSLPAALNGKAKSITIEGLAGLSSGDQQDSFDAGKSGTVLTIATSVPVTIKNLKITGGSSTSGGGIYMSSGTDVTLDNGCLIGEDKEELPDTANYGNKASNGGGGIYNSGGTLTLKSGSKVCYNYDKSSDYYGDGGGGIRCTIGSLKMEEGSVISYNKTSSRGGGVRLGKDDVTETATFTMTGGEICYNDALGWGGGVQMVTSATTFNFNGGKIHHNLVSGTGGGWGQSAGAIYMDGGTFNMNGNAEISDNSANHQNGGLVFVRAGCNVHLNGGLIQNNMAKNGGSGAIGAAGYTEFTMSGSISIPYGGAAGNNDIHLPAGKSITINGPLTGTDTFGITKTGTLTSGDTIIVAGGTVSSLTPYKTLFTLTNSEWKKKLSGDKKKLLLASLDEGEALPSSYDDLKSGETYSVAYSSDLMKLAEFSSGGCDFSGVTLQLDTDITIDTAWTPVGNGTAFKGTFDGDDNTVTFASEANAEAFFGTVGGTVKNLKVAGSASVAGIAKKASPSSVIEDCENSATIISSTDQEYCAGIVAEVQSNAIIKGCVNTGSITSNRVLPASNYSEGAGGITGRINSEGIIDSCVNKGSVTGPNAGGIAASGTYKAVIRNAYNSGNITSKELHAGGIAAVMSGSGAEISNASHVYNCFNSGSVTAEGTAYVVYAGGIVGRLGWGNASWAQNCLNIGNVSLSGSAASSSRAGALFGLKDSYGKIDFCYYKDGCVSSGLGAGNKSTDEENQCVKATQSGTADAVISVNVTLDETTYSAATSTVLSLLNAWVTKNSTDGMYYEWKAGEDHWPRLKTE